MSENYYALSIQAAHAIRTQAIHEAMQRHPAGKGRTMTNKLPDMMDPSEFGDWLDATANALDAAMGNIRDMADMASVDPLGEVGDEVLHERAWDAVNLAEQVVSDLSELRDLWQELLENGL